MRWCKEYFKHHKNIEKKKKLITALRIYFYNHSEN